MQRYLAKIDRFFAWVLFVGILLYFITGFGMTKGIIDETFATKMHLDYLSYIVLVAFVIHTSYAIHLALKRWQLWNTASKSLLVLFFLAFFGFFIYADKYYTKNNSQSSTTSTTTTSNSDSTSSASTSSAETKTFTLSELSQYDGKNGNSAYVAVDGKVYDLTAVFKSGKHYSHYAGKELTNAFYSYHAARALGKYPVVGTLAS